MNFTKRVITIPLLLLILIVFADKIVSDEIANTNDSSDTKIFDVRSLIDPSQITPIADSFAMFYNDTSEVGYMLNKLSIVDSQIILWDLSTFGRTIREEATCILDSRTLKTISIEFKGTFGQGPLDTKLIWEENIVSGYKAIQHVDSSKQGSEKISRALSNETLTRTEFILCFIRTIPLEVGMSFPLTLYASMDDTLWDVSISVTSKELIKVPAGEFMTYKVEMKNGSPSNTFYVTDSSPMRLIRVDIDGMPLRIDLAGSF